MRLILVRHGQTEGNKKKILEGHSHGKLSEKGKRQAEKLARRLECEKIDLIISSDLARALDTAKEVAKFHQGVNLVTDERLRERNLGSVQGEKVKNVDWDNLPEDVESRENMEERIFELIEENLKENLDKTILFVAHGGINRAFIRKTLGEEAEKHIDWENQKNTCVNIFELGENGKIEGILLNCVEHLK